MVANCDLEQTKLILDFIGNTLGGLGLFLTFLAVVYWIYKANS